MKDIKLQSQRQIKWWFVIGVIVGIAYLISLSLLIKDHLPSRRLFIITSCFLFIHGLFYAMSVSSMAPSRNRSLLGWGFGFLHFGLCIYLNYLFVYVPRTPEMIEDQSWMNYIRSLSSSEILLFLISLFYMTDLGDRVRAKLNE